LLISQPVRYPQGNEIVENHSLAYKIVQMAEGENLEKSLLEFDFRRSP
jgi:hypothetical protein